MRPNAKFLKQEKHFWANVRTISQGLGYTDRKTGQIKVPTLTEIQKCLLALGLTTKHVIDNTGKATAFGETLLQYFAYRAEVLNGFVKTHLMDAERAKKLFEEMRERLSPKCPLPMNLQKGEKKTNAYFTCVINMLIEANLEGLPCNYSPKVLTTITQNNEPLRTLARRLDGAFPTIINPLVVWEIKEYYFTTTFGSRVADGVYETLLDGLELEELRDHKDIDVKHYLMIDAYFTWWVKGRSYLLSPHRYASYGLC